MAGALSVFLFATGRASRRWYHPNISLRAGVELDRGGAVRGVNRFVCLSATYEPGYVWLLLIFGAHQATFVVCGVRRGESSGRAGVDCADMGEERPLLQTAVRGLLVLVVRELWKRLHIAIEAYNMFY